MGGGGECLGGWVDDSDGLVGGWEGRECSQNGFPFDNHQSLFAMQPKPVSYACKCC